MRIDVTDTCWLWTGAVKDNGYGVTSYKGRQWYVHRLVWTIARGDIPKGLQMDHLCRVRNCCNPAHLEPVTQRENLIRGETWARDNAAKTHCPKGHLLEGDNLIVELGKTGREQRKCRTCHNERRYKGSATLACVICGQPFESKRRDALYCTRRCERIAAKRRRAQ